MSQLDASSTNSTLFGWQSSKRLRHLSHLEVANVPPPFQSAQIVISQTSARKAHRFADEASTAPSCPILTLPWTPAAPSPSPPSASFRWPSLDLPALLKAAGFHLHAPTSRHLTLTLHLSPSTPPLPPPIPSSPSSLPLGTFTAQFSIDLDVILAPSNAYSPPSTPLTPVLLFHALPSGAYAMPLQLPSPPTHPTEASEEEPRGTEEPSTSAPSALSNGAHSRSEPLVNRLSSTAPGRPPRSNPSSPRPLSSSLTKGGLAVPPPHPASPAPPGHASSTPSLPNLDKGTTATGPGATGAQRGAAAAASRHSRSRSITQFLGDVLFGAPPAPPPPPPVQAAPREAPRRVIDLRRAKEGKLRDLERELLRIAEARRRLDSLAAERASLSAEVDRRLAPPEPESAEDLLGRVAEVRAALNQLGHDRAEVRARMAVTKSRSAALRRTLATEAQGLTAGLSALRDARDRLQEAQAGLHGPGGLLLLQEAEGALVHRQLQMITTLGAIFALRAVPGHPDFVLQSTAKLDRVDRMWWSSGGAAANGTNHYAPSPSMGPSTPSQSSGATSPLPASSRRPPAHPSLAPVNRTPPYTGSLQGRGGSPHLMPDFSPLPPASTGLHEPPAASPLPLGEELPLQCSIAAVPVEDWSLLEGGRPKLDGCDSEANDRLNAALGLMCLLTLLAAKYLHVPLLHPMVFRGSSSFVVDGRSDRPATAKKRAGREALAGSGLSRRSLVAVPVPGAVANGGAASTSAKPRPTGAAVQSALSPYAWPHSLEQGGPGSHAPPSPGTAPHPPPNKIAVVAAPLEHSPRQPSTTLLLRAISLLHANVTQTVMALGLQPRGPRSNPAVVLEGLCVLAGASQHALATSTHLAGAGAPSSGTMGTVHHAGPSMSSAASDSVRQ